MTTSNRTRSKVKLKMRESRAPSFVRSSIVIQVFIISALGIINCDLFNRVSNANLINDHNHHREHLRSYHTHSQNAITGHRDGMRSNIHWEHPLERRSRQADESLPREDKLPLALPRGQIKDDTESIKVAALATKLDQWLQCSRMNLLVRQQQQQQQSASGPIDDGMHQDQIKPEMENQQAQKVQARNLQQQLESISCPPHFDGHLCWPQAQAGEQIQLPCPKIDYLLTKRKDEQLSPKTNQQHQQQQPQPLKSIPNSPTGGDLNLTQEITLANLQSIKPTGVRAGITSAATNQQQETRNRDGAVRMDEILRSSQDGRWQAEPDYSECQASKAEETGDGKRINNLFDPTDEWVKLGDNNSADARLFGSLIEQLERIEVSIDPYSERDLLEQWTLCIGEVMRIQRQQQQSSSSGFCPIIFDGWRCWPSTKAGEIAYVNCPSNQPGFSAERKAYKICTLEADWYRHPMTNRYWSNYTTCVDTVDLAFRTKILNLYVIGNLISLIALTVSLIIFVSFKSLNCTRVTIHKNLFLSFITNNLMWIIWYTYVVNDADLLQLNPLGCRFWHILLHYFLVSNYFWMFCEGLYLHTLLVVAFVSEDKILKWFYLLGWLTPVPIIITYAYNRSYDDYYTNFCWMEESPHNIILMAPIGISLLLNLVFLINIVRVLVTKLRANNSPDTHQTRKAVRATLILIPLLGLHYMLTPFRPEAKSEWEMIYEIIAAVCTSFQGLCVAMLFCFCNGEVITVVKKKLKDSCFFNRAGKRAMRSRSNTTISNVFNNSSLTNNHNSGHHLSSGGGGGSFMHNTFHNEHHHRTGSGAQSLGMAVTCSLSPGNGNLVSNQLQRPFLGNNHKIQLNSVPGLVNHNSSSLSGGDSQRSSVMTTTTNVSPVLQPFQQQVAEDKKLTRDSSADLSDRPLRGEAALGEETVKLLQQTENNNNHGERRFTNAARS